MTSREYLIPPCKLSSANAKFWAAWTILSLSTWFTTTRMRYAAGLRLFCIFAGVYFRPFSTSPSLTSFAHACMSIAKHLHGHGAHSRWGSLGRSPQRAWRRRMVFGCIREPGQILCFDYRRYVGMYRWLSQTWLIIDDTTLETAHTHHLLPLVLYLITPFLLCIGLHSPAKDCVSRSQTRERDGRWRWISHHCWLWICEVSERRNHVYLLRYASVFGPRDLCQHRTWFCRGSLGTSWQSSLSISRSFFPVRWRCRCHWGLRYDGESWDLSLSHTRCFHIILLRRVS